MVSFIKQMHATGWPIRKADVEQMAMLMIRRRSADEPKPLGNRWFRRFRKRHPCLDFKFIATLSRARTLGMTVSRGLGLFALVELELLEYDLKNTAMFTMDETGVQIGTPSVGQRFLVPAGATKTLRPAIVDGNQETVTIIECIGADGSVLPPLYVFKGRTLDLAPMVDERHGGRVTASDTGWTNTSITMEWFREVFLPNSERIAGKGVHRLLIMDGHKSHFPLELIELAVEKDVSVICLPAHTTQALSPLDVSCFRPLKERWAEEIRQETLLTGCVKRSDVIRLYENARDKAMTSANAISGFANTGLWPFTGLKAIPPSKFVKDALTDKEMDELIEDHNADDEALADLWALVDQQRTAKAKAVLVQASREIERMRALELMFGHLFKRQQDHLAALKKKPATFRVHLDGAAKLYTSDESIRIMREAEQQKQQAEAEKLARAEAREQERVEREAAKEREKEEKQKRREQQKEDRAAKEREKEEAAAERRRLMEEKRELKRQQEEAKAAAKEAKAAAKAQKAAKKQAALKRSRAVDNDVVGNDGDGSGSGGSVSKKQRVGGLVVSG
ncbi:unnamed protein product [Tilletia caries]|nr:unnamed protein product [Tilletia caries]